MLTVSMRLWFKSEELTKYGFPSYHACRLSVKMNENQSHVSNLVQGTPLYISPEVVKTGEPPLHGRMRPADIQ